MVGEVRRHCSLPMSFQQVCHRRILLISSNHTYLWHNMTDISCSNDSKKSLNLSQCIKFNGVSMTFALSIISDDRKCPTTKYLNAVSNVNIQRKSRSTRKWISIFRRSIFFWPWSMDQKTRWGRWCGSLGLCLEMKLMIGWPDDPQDHSFL